MGIEKTDKGWKVDIRPGGRDARRFRKTFKTKAEALKFEAWAKTQYTVNPEWMPTEKDRRRLSALITRWHDLHGRNLKDGEGRKRTLLNLTEALGNPLAYTITAQTFTHYRARRMEEGTSASTVNHELAYLRALFNELERLGEWSKGNPLAKVRQMKTDQTELAYLTAEEVERLLETLDRAPKNKDAAIVARICLSTGARWSEAETLRAEQVKPGRIDFTGTKSGKNRSIPIDDCLHRHLMERGPGRLFSSCYSAFREGIERAGIVTPPGQLSHVLRHTFASHFMQRGGNILSLQRILGHASLTMTMRYAHLSPDHFEDAMRLNPLANSV